MRWLFLFCAALVGASSIWLVAACTTPAAELRFTGTEHPVVAAPHDIEVIEGAKPPPGHQVIGVVTASCATLNGTTGLLADGPCNHEAMLDLLRDKAAAVGGQAIVDPQCGDNELERQIESRDGGYTTTTTRELTSCQATVTRRSGAVAVATSQATAVPRGEALMIGEISVRVRLERAKGAPRPGPRDEHAVGEMEAFPSGYVLLGRAIAECEAACARATARRALKRRAADAGALAIARTHCELLGQRWRCSTQLVGPAVAEELGGAPDAEVPSVDDTLDAGAPDGAVIADGDAGRDAGSDTP